MLLLQFAPLATRWRMLIESIRDCAATLASSCTKSILIKLPNCHLEKENLFYLLFHLKRDEKHNMHSDNSPLNLLNPADLPANLKVQRVSPLTYWSCVQAARKEYLLIKSLKHQFISSIRFKKAYLQHTLFSGQFCILKLQLL